MERPDVHNIEETIMSLSPKDREAVRRCQRDGFLLGSFFGLSVQMLRQIAFHFSEFSDKIKKPTLNSNLASLMVSVVIGYIGYVPMCAFKVIDPILKEKLEQQKQEKDFPSHLQLSNKEENPSFQSTLNLDLDGSDSKFSHLSLSFEPSLTDKIVLPEEEEVKPNYQTTYEDLRKQNRESYRAKNSGKKGIDKPLNQPVEMAELPQLTELPKKKVRTNQYGDPLD